MRAAILLAIVCGLAATPTIVRGGDQPAPESVDLRYARAQLQLAEANFTRVAQSNKRMSGAVPSSVVAEYQRDVQVAKTRLEQAKAGPAAGDFQTWLQRADAERKTTEATWKNATAVNNRVPSSFDPLDVERLRLRAEVAKLQSERGQSLTDAPHEAQLQWELDLLDNQLQRLKEESNQTSPLIRIYPSWTR